MNTNEHENGEAKEFVLDRGKKKFRVGALTHGIAKLSVVLCTKRKNQEGLNEITTCHIRPCRGLFRRDCISAMDFPRHPARFRGNSSKWLTRDGFWDGPFKRQSNPDYSGRKLVGVNCCRHCFAYPRARRARCECPGLVSILRRALRDIRVNSRAGILNHAD